MITPDDVVERERLFKALRWSLQALADSDSEQRALFPDVARKPDQLALDFDHAASVVRDNYGIELTREQADSLAGIDRKLATMSSDGADFDVELWSEAALRSSSHWDDVRRLAASALDAFGWPRETVGDRGVLS